MASRLVPRVVHDLSQLFQMSRLDCRGGECRVGPGKGRLTRIADKVGGGTSKRAERRRLHAFVKHHDGIGQGPPCLPSLDLS